MASTALALKITHIYQKITNNILLVQNSIQIWDRDFPWSWDVNVTEIYMSFIALSFWAQVHILFRHPDFFGNYTSQATLCYVGINLYLKLYLEHVAFDK